MSTDAVIVEQQPGLSQTERVIDTYVAPSRTFHDIFRSRSWWLPFVLSCIFSYAFMFTVAKKVGFEQIVQQKMEQRAEKTGQQLSPEQRAQGLKMGTAITQGIFIASPLMSLLFVLFFSFLLWLGMNFVLGGTAEYTRLFTLTVYAGLPRLLMLIVAIVSIWFGNNDSFNINNPAGTNIGYYLSADAPKWMISLGSSLDVTMIWMLALMALGGAILAKVKVRNSMILVFATWFVIIVAKALLA